jgi:hypothetical protein
MGHSEQQARAQYESIIELVERMKGGDSHAFDEIYADALSVRVRSNWENLGNKLQASEFEILLCTGGPAVRIIGNLDEGLPSSGRLQYQDWFTPWQDWDKAEEAVLLDYASCFYFGE